MEELKGSIKGEAKVAFQVQMQAQSNNSATLIFKKALNNNVRLAQLFTEKRHRDIVC